MYNMITLERQNGIGAVTLNRPEKMNAICPELVLDLLNVIEELRKDDTIRVILLTGAGPAFCAGGDVSSLLSSTDNPVELMESSRQGARIISGMRTMLKPWIAAVNGPAIGAGCNLALGCDMIIAGENASFSQAFVNLGLHPDTGGIYLTTRLVGTAKACELIFTGKTIGADEAERIGLINQVVPPDQLQETAKKLAMKLAHGPSKAIGMAKASIYQAVTMNMESVLEAEVRAASLSIATEDAREGIKAILEKRKPEFKGK